MRKAILLFSAIIAFALSAWGENTTGVFMDFYLRSNEENATDVNRSLVQIPILEAVYDSDTKTIRITSPESQVADVYVYNSNGAIVGYANSLNTTIQLPSVGSYTIYLDLLERIILYKGEGWYGVGYINYKSLFYAYHEETTPFNDNRCRECFAFPICSGGCAWYRLKNLKEDKDFNFCSLFIDKSILEKCLLKNFDNVTINNNNSPKIKVC